MKDIKQGFKKRNKLLMQMSTPGKGGGGVLWVLSDRDDQSNFWGLKVLISGLLLFFFFGGGGGGSKSFARSF